MPVEISYLTGGLTWHAEYVAVQSESGTSLDLQGWATVENTSGETYENAREAGRGPGEPGGPGPAPMPYEMMARGAVAGDAAQKLVERGFSEYHLYDCLTARRSRTRK